MKLSKYIKKLEEVLKDNGDLDVVYSIDEEGNAFNEVYFSPSIGHYDEEDKDFYNESEIDEINDEIKEEEPNIELLEINSVCVN